MAVNPAIPEVELLMGGLILANRILGFVNAPSLMQLAITRCQGARVDISLYQRNRDLLYTTLTDAGFTVPQPDGAFYLFPKAPIMPMMWLLCRSWPRSWYWWCRAAVLGVPATSASRTASPRTGWRGPCRCSGKWASISVKISVKNVVIPAGRRRSVGEGGGRSRGPRARPAAPMRPAGGCGTTVPQSP